MQLWERARRAVRTSSALQEGSSLGRIRRMRLRRFAQKSPARPHKGDLPSRAAAASIQDGGRWWDLVAMVSDGTSDSVSTESRTSQAVKCSITRCASKATEQRRLAMATPLSLYCLLLRFLRAWFCCNAWWWMSRSNSGLEDPQPIRHRLICTSVARVMNPSRPCPV